jgi:hypothetical protein
MILSRKQYDALIIRHPEFMAQHWQTLKRRWSLAGVEVSGAPATLASLAALI